VRPSHVPSPGPATPTSAVNPRHGCTQCLTASIPATFPVQPQWQCGLKKCASASSKFCLELAQADASGRSHCGQANSSTCAKCSVMFCKVPSSFRGLGLCKGYQTAAWVQNCIKTFPQFSYPYRNSIPLNVTRFRRQTI